MIEFFLVLKQLKESKKYMIDLEKRINKVIINSLKNEYYMASNTNDRK